MFEASQFVPFLELGSIEESKTSQRAATLAEDLNWISFEKFAISTQTYPFPDPRNGQIIPAPLAEYHFGETGFSVQNAENANDDVAEWFGGTGLDRGNLQFLSKVGETARSLIPNYWLKSKRLRDALRNPPQHLNTVEEIWWLARWAGIEDIKMGERLVAGSEADVDWSFFVARKKLRVNLEVKRIQRDPMRHARGRPFTRNWFTRFCAEKVLPKFRPSGIDEINVLAISLFGEIDRDVQLTVANWLSTDQRLVDAVALSSREARRRSDFDLQLLNAKAQTLKAYTLDPDEEDKSLWFVLEVPMKIPGFPDFGSSRQRP